MGQKKQHGLPACSASLDPNGYLHLSRDLIPAAWEAAKKQNFHIIPDFQKRSLELKPANGEKSNLLTRRAIFTNEYAKSPQVSVKAALNVLGVHAPKVDRVRCAVRKKKDGSIVVRFPE